MKKMYEKHQVIQDMLIPLDKLGEALDVFHKELQVGQCLRLLKPCVEPESWGGGVQL